MEILSLGNPLWMWGLAAAAAPVIIHLYFRRRYKTVIWAAMEYLREALRKSSRRRRLEHWLLMAARMLLLALLAGAFARPFLHSEAAAALSLAPRYRIVVLDHSLSMAARSGGESLLQKGKTLAQELVRTLRGGDRAAWIAVPGPAGTEGFTRDFERMEEEISDLKASPLSADNAQVLGRLDVWLAENQFPQAELFWITDLQRGSWSRTAMAGWGAFAQKAKDRLTVTILDVGDESMRNMAVTQTALLEGRGVKGLPSTVRATVSNFSTVEAPGVVVDLWVDDVKKASRQVTVGARQERFVDFPVAIEEPGIHRIVLEIPADPLEEDNRRPFALPVGDEVRLAVIDGKWDAQKFDRESTFLQIALDPWQEGEKRRAYRIEAAGPERLNDLPAFLSGADACILANVPSLPEPAVAALEGFVRSGGGLLIALGDRVDAEAYNRLLYRDGQGMLPYELGPAAHPAAGEEGRWIAADPTHPLLAPFPPERPDLSRPLFRGWVRPLGEPSPLVRTPLRFSDGSPAVSERNFGQGRVMLYASTLGTGWTNLPARPVFVPWIHQMVRRMVQGRSGVLNLRVGEEVRWPLAPEQLGREIALTGPDGKRRSLLPRQEGGAWEVRAPALDLAGFWKLQIGTEEIPLAATPPPEESDLEREPPEQVQSFLTGLPLKVGRGVPDAPAVRQGTEIWRPLIAAALLLLYLESWLALRASKG